MKNTTMYTKVKNVNYSGNKVTEGCKLKKMTLIPVLGGDHSVFNCKSDVTCRFFIVALYQVEAIFFYSHPEGKIHRLIPLFEGNLLCS